MLSRIVVAGSVIATGLMGCSSSSSAPAGTTLGPNTMDVRVATPAANPAFLDMFAPEITVAPGSERMTCIHLHYDAEDVAFSDFEAQQGKWGHHAILLGALKALPPGTVEDCTNPEDMAKYTAFAIPVQLPDGHAVLLRHGVDLVLQSHYVNTSSHSLLTRDVVRMKKRAMADVKTWAAPFATNSLSFHVPPKSPLSYTFDCTMPQNGNLLFVGGHMHEWGKKITIEYGTDTKSLSPLYSTDWKVEYRDAPPITDMTAKPLAIVAGAVVRTTCQWDNTVDVELAFPKEMCASFGYITGTKDSVVCRDGTMVTP